MKQQNLKNAEKSAIRLKMYAEKMKKYREKSEKKGKKAHE